MTKIKTYFDKEVEDKFSSIINKSYYNQTINNNCDIVVDGIMLPTKKQFDKFYKGGVVDKNNKFVKNSQFIRQDISGSVVDSYNFSTDDIDSKDIDVLYAGVLINHFGHFLVESTSRLWYWVENINKNLDIAFLMPKNQKIFPQFWEFMELLGIDRNKIHIIKKVTKFKKIYVPQQSHIINTSYNDKFIVPFNYISSLLPNQSKDKIYLSRSKFNKGPVLLGEKPLEQTFVNNGYKVIYPEKLSLKQQILTIKNAKDIAGISGTAMHLALFADKETNITILERSDVPLAEQSIINEAIGATVFHVGVNANPFPTDHSVGPLLLAITENIINYCNERKYKINNKLLNKIKSSESKKFIKVWLRNYTQTVNNEHISNQDSLLARRLLYMASAFIPLKKWIKQKVKSWKKRKWKHNEEIDINTFYNFNSNQ